MVDGSADAPRRSVEPHSWPRPRQLASWLRRLGPTFIKVGQFLALRPDLIPQEYCDELLGLLDRVPPFPWPVARRIVAEDLGDEPEKIFAWINPTPAAAASLAQVHYARTKDGAEVAVKVQREGIRQRVDKDFRRAQWLVRLLTATDIATGVDAREVIAEFRRWLDEEIDSERELRNIIRMYEASRDTDAIRIPRPFPAYCGARVVTTEYLHGVPFSELIAAQTADEPPRVEELGFDRDALATSLLEAVLTQIFRHQFFHADVHPGNLIALPGNQVGFVDFGLVDWLDATVSQRQMEYLSAVYDGDVDRMYRSLAALLAASRRTDMDAFRNEFVAATRAWLRARSSEIGTVKSGRSTIARYLVEVMRVVRRHDLRIPGDLLSMYRTLLTSETVANRIGSRADLGLIGSRLFLELRSESAADAFMPEMVRDRTLDLLTLFSDGPGQLSRILSDLAEERFVLPVRTIESAADRHDANTRARIVVLAIVAVGIAVLAAAAGWSGQPRWTVQAPLWIALGALYIWVAVLWRRLP